MTINYHSERELCDSNILKLFGRRGLSTVAQCRTWPQPIAYYNFNLNHTVSCPPISKVFCPNLCSNYTRWVIVSSKPSVHNSHAKFRLITWVFFLQSGNQRMWLCTIVEVGYVFLFTHPELFEQQKPVGGRTWCKQSPGSSVLVLRFIFQPVTRSKRILLYSIYPCKCRYKMRGGTKCR